MEIQYTAATHTYWRQEKRDGEPCFVPLSVPRAGMEWDNYRDVHSRRLNAFDTRDEFLDAKTPADALAFLGSVGDFSPLGDRPQLTWAMFRRWQDFARTMHLTDLRQKLIAHSDPEHATDAAFWQMFLMVNGEPHTYFEVPSDVSQQSLADTRSRLHHVPREEIKKDELFPLIDTNTAEGRAASALVLKFADKLAEQQFAGFVEALREGAHTATDRQRQLERHFLRLAPETYTIDWSSQPPRIVISANTALGAIAAAIHVDRAAGKRFARCKNARCGKIIDLSQQRGTNYCPGERCKQAQWRREDRARKRST